MPTILLPSRSIIPVVREISLTNLLAHSNFDATTDWTAFNANISVSSNELLMTATAQYGYTQQTRAITNGRKYYHACWVDSPNASITTALSDNIANTQYVFHSASSGYEFLSDVYTATASTSTGSYYVMLDVRASGWTQVKAKYATIIDLTAAFGAGYEPTKAQMDALMEQFPNRHFTGTVNALYEG